MITHNKKESMSAFRVNSTLTKLSVRKNCQHCREETLLKHRHCRREAQSIPHPTVSVAHLEQSTAEYTDNISLSHTYYFQKSDKWVTFGLLVIFV